MARITAKIEGVAALNKKLEKFEKNLRNQGVRKVSRNVAKRAFLPGIRRNAPVRGEARGGTRGDAGFNTKSGERREVTQEGGALQASFIVKALKRSRAKNAITGVRVGNRNTDTFYGNYLEYGWNHWLAGPLQGLYFGRAVFDGKKRTALVLYEKELKSWIEREAQK